MNRSVIRVVAGIIVFAMLASVVALIFAASSGNTNPTPPQQQLDIGELEELLEQAEDGEDALPSLGPSGLPSASVAVLPDEALAALGLIAADGPYPYSQDNSTFQNREDLLPDRASGYYREFTVDTPGIDHRGARRLVTGAEGELYYTADHYDSFSEVLDWVPGANNSQ